MMFACIFFYEDKSLSVVGEKSKKLELMESFKEGGKVKMNWGKVGMFSGCIVKVHGKLQINSLNIYLQYMIPALNADLLVTFCGFQILFLTLCI